MKAAIPCSSAPAAAVQFEHMEGQIISALVKKSNIAVSVSSVPILLLNCKSPGCGCHLGWIMHEEGASGTYLKWKGFPIADFTGQKTSNVAKKMCGKSGKHQEEEEIECEVWYLVLHCSVCKLYLHHACRILVFFSSHILYFYFPCFCCVHEWFKQKRASAWTENLNLSLAVPKSPTHCSLQVHRQNKCKNKAGKTSCCVAKK